jgi:hypothetical protein
LYELITSKPPFSSGNVDRQIREKIPPLMAERRKELEVEGEIIDDAWEKTIAACLAKNPDRRPQSFVEVAQRLQIDSPKTVRAARAIQPPTIAPASAPAPATSTTGTLPPIPKSGGLSPAKIALILGGVAALVLFFLGAVGIWYFVFRKPAAPKSVAAAQTVQTTTVADAQPQPSARTSGLADTAKDVNPFKPEPKSNMRPQPSVAQQRSAPSVPNVAPQPVTPVNDFTGG